MKAMRKMMVGASVGALALVALGGINAEAAGEFASSKTISGLQKGDAVSFDAVKLVKNVPTYNANAKWDLYEDSSSADLSNLKTTKDSYIAIKSSGTTSIYKVKQDTQKKYKATCDGDTISITVDGKDVDSTKADEIGKFSWRTANSNWTAFTTTKLSLTPYTMQGATIYIRYTGASSFSSAMKDSTEKITVDDKEVTVKEIAPNSFSATEFKVKVPKKANAPAITVDYVKGEIKANKKAVYKTGNDVNAALGQSKWSDVMTANYPINNAEAGAFIMQIPADTTKKKPASKVSFVTWPKGTAPTLESYTQPSYSGSSLNGSKKGTLIKDGSADALVYEAVENAKAEKATFVLENKTTGDKAKTYEICKLKTENSVRVIDGKVVATVKPGKKVTLKASSVSAATELYIREAGDKKALKLPTQFTSNAFKPAYLQTPAATPAPQ